MDSVIKRVKNSIWFFPYLDRFMICFGIYMFAGTVAFSMQGVGFFKAVTLTFVSGIILTALVIISYPLWRFEREPTAGKPLPWRLLFGPLRSSGSSLTRSIDETILEPNPEPSQIDTGQEKEPSSGIEDEKFKRRMRANQIDSAERAAKRMHDKIIHTGLVVALYMFIFWFAAEEIGYFFSQLFGAGVASSDSLLGPQGEISFKVPKDLFVVDLFAIVIMWYVLIVYLPRWLVYILLLGMSMMRIVFFMFGPMASIFILQIGQLPVFYAVMMVFLFWSILWPSLQQVKYFRPGDASWGKPKGSMRGQPEVRAIVETELAKFQDFISGKSKRQPTRGMIFEGPPGTGKTLYAMEIATEYNIPFILADGAAFAGAPLPDIFMNIVQWKTNSIVDEYGGAVFFIDECEQFLRVREGMAGGGPTPGMEMLHTQHASISDVWDILPYNSVGVTSECGIMYDSAQARERFWQLKSPLSLGKEPKIHTHPFMIPVGMGGGNKVIYPFLTWVQGAGSPPVMETLKRRFINDTLNALFIPTHIPGTQILLRMPPAKPKHRTILFIGATNRAFMLDPAIRRPGRMGVTGRFKTPDLESRKDIICYYIKKAYNDGLMRSELLEDAAIDELARAYSGMSPAEIEAAINSSYDVRSTHVKNLQRIKSLINSGVSLDKLLEQDRKYWLRHEEELKSDAWEEERADMRSLLEARNNLIYGRSDPGMTTAEHKGQTGVHEQWGHLLILKGVLGMKRKYNVIRPHVISVLPRGNALGMVAHMPMEERDPKPQRFYEGLIRVSIGSTVAERFFFGENQPGVASDLENATRIACFMVGKAGMSPYKCSKEDEEKYLTIGETLISVSDDTVTFLNPFAKDFIEKVLSSPESRKRVTIILGKAFVDDYRFIKANVLKNYAFHEGVLSELLRLDEIGGIKLEAIWDQLDDVLVTWDQFTEKELSWWPDKIARVENYFYSSSNKPEIEEVLAK